jgi:hypothetical protein
MNLSQNQQVHRIINKNKMHFQPLHMFRQMNCHPQGALIKEVQVLIASNYTIDGFAVAVFTHVTI